MPKANKKTFADPDVIWTRNLLIWSQTRYRCATEPPVSYCRMKHLMFCYAKREYGSITCDVSHWIVSMIARLRGQVVRRRSRKAKIEGSNPFGAIVSLHMFSRLKSMFVIFCCCLYWTKWSLLSIPLQQTNDENGKYRQFPASSVGRASDS